MARDKRRRRRFRNVNSNRKKERTFHTAVLTFIGALAHPPPAHRDPLSRWSPRVHRPILLRCLRCHRVLHLGLDEELQDVRVLLVLARLVVATVSGAPGRFWTQHQVAVVEPPLHGFIHDVEPGPGLYDAPDVVLALVGLLQVL